MTKTASIQWNLEKPTKTFGDTQDVLWDLGSSPTCKKVSPLKKIEPQHYDLESYQGHM